ncbi:MAG: tRNA1(Val) (adenine(37)-N6)-methyltransferase [Prevotella sp.]
MSNNHFSFKQFTVRQEKCAMKVGTDGTLLGAWAETPTTSNKPRILDIGTGTGLIALMMAQRFASADIVAIDIDEDAVAQAQENVRNSPFADRITVMKARLQDYTDNKFDAMVCNPPFFVDALPCPDSKRSVARHATTLTFQELMSSAFRLLTDHGELSVIIPVDALSLMNGTAAIAGMCVKRICKVKTTAGKSAKRTLLSFVKHPTDTIPEEKELLIGSEEYRILTGDFYL